MPGYRRARPVARQTWAALAAARLCPTARAVHTGAASSFAPVLKAWCNTGQPSMAAEQDAAVLQAALMPHAWPSGWFKDVRASHAQIGTRLAQLSGHTGVQSLRVLAAACQRSDVPVTGGAASIGLRFHAAAVHAAWWAWAGQPTTHCTERVAELQVLPAADRQQALRGLAMLACSSWVPPAQVAAWLRHAASWASSDDIPALLTLCMAAGSELPACASALLQHCTHLAPGRDLPWPARVRTASHAATLAAILQPLAGSAGMLHGPMMQDIKPALEQWASAPRAEQAEHAVPAALAAAALHALGVPVASKLPRVRDAVAKHGSTAKGASASAQLAAAVARQLSQRDAQPLQGACQSLAVPISRLLQGPKGKTWMPGSALARAQEQGVPMPWAVPAWAAQMQQLGQASTTPEQLGSDGALGAVAGLLQAEWAWNWAGSSAAQRAVTAVQPTKWSLSHLGIEAVSSTQWASAALACGSVVAAAAAHSLSDVSAQLADSAAAAAAGAVHHHVGFKPPTASPVLPCTALAAERIVQVSPGRSAAGDAAWHTAANAALMWASSAGATDFHQAAHAITRKTSPVVPQTVLMRMNGCWPPHVARDTASLTAGHALGVGRCVLTPNVAARPALREALLAKHLPQTAWRAAAPLLHAAGSGACFPSAAMPAGTVDHMIATLSALFTEPSRQPHELVACCSSAQRVLAAAELGLAQAHDAERCFLEAYRAAQLNNERDASAVLWHAALLSTHEPSKELQQAVKRQASTLLATETLADRSQHAPALALCAASAAALREPQALQLAALLAELLQEGTVPLVSSAWGAAYAAVQQLVQHHDLPWLHVLLTQVLQGASPVAVQLVDSRSPSTLAAERAAVFAGLQQSRLADTMPVAALQQCLEPYTIALRAVEMAGEVDLVTACFMQAWESEAGALHCAEHVGDLESAVIQQRAALAQWSSSWAADGVQAGRVASLIAAETRA